MSTAASGVAGKLATAGTGAVFAALGHWVASGAVWLVGQVGRALSDSTSVDLGGPWFGAHERVMAALGAAVVLPMACCAAIQAIYHQSASMLLRTFFVYVPLSLVLTAVAVELVQIGVAVTDELSSQVMASAGVDATNLFSGMSSFLAGTTAGAAAPGFVVFIGALFVALAALVLWLELVVRVAAVSAAALFLPLALAALVWPAVAHWCRRLADTLVALVLSKLVIAAVLSLGVGALGGGLNVSGNGGGGFAAVVTGIALLVIATVSPFTLLRLVPAVEAGAVAHLESARHRVTSAAVAGPRAGWSLALDVVRGSQSADGFASTYVGSSAPALAMVAGTALPTLGTSAGDGASTGHGGSDGAPAGRVETPPSTDIDGAAAPRSGTAVPAKRSAGERTEEVSSSGWRPRAIDDGHITVPGPAASAGNTDNEAGHGDGGRDAPDLWGEDGGEPR